MTDEAKRPWEQRVHEDLRRVIDYLNDEVVPEVRRSSSAALRTAAQELAKLAQHMDDSKAQATRESGDEPPSGGSSKS
jgi:hypothetical protein